MNDFDTWIEHYKATHGPLKLEIMEDSLAAWKKQIGHYSGDSFSESYKQAQANRNILAKVTLNFEDKPMTKAHVL